MESKQELRLSVQEEFTTYSAETLKEMGSKVITNIMSIPEFSNSGTTLFYHPLPDEVNIIPLIKETLVQGKRVCFPLCKPPSNRLIIKSVISLETELVPGTYGILEPDPACETIPIDALNCIITPGRAFDRKGNRVGRGAGYYDNLLKETNALTIAPCMSFQLFDKVPAQAHDISVDIITTEDEVIRCA